MHADVTGECPQLRARSNKMNAKRDVCRGEAIRCACAHRYEAVVQSRMERGDPEPRQPAPNTVDARIDRAAGDPRGEGTQSRSSPLEPFGGGRPRIGAEIRNLELESLDVEGRDAEVREHEAPHASMRVKRER